MNKSIIMSGLVALVVSLTSIGLYTVYEKNQKTIKIEHISSQPSSKVLYSLDKDGAPIPLDFNETAEKVLTGVVHIKSTTLFDRNSNTRERSIPSPFRDFFGEEFERFFQPGKAAPQSPNSRDSRPARVGTGSGVIISTDGYIVTNNHVIAEADDIEVTLHDNRTYKATVIGTDPSTDIALIQIKEDNLPTIPFVNSEEVKIGQWVLAVGNPMGLNSTVTAGIVSATGRSINILRDKYAVENFIQTDAAINPGNSGGALVNLEGGLVGINTAIASPTGTFAGYGFAVPTNIVNKVVEDLIEFGSVQRGVLGVMIRTLDGNLAKEKDIAITQGVYVDSLLANSAAAQAGMKVGDIILAVDGRTVKTSPELQGMIAGYRPGEEVTVGIDRAGKNLELKVVLNNRQGEAKVAAKESVPILSSLGADFETVEAELAKELRIKGGVKVTQLYPGKLRRYTQMREGFIITKLDGKPIHSVDDLESSLSKKEGGVMLEGIYEDIPGEYYYAFGM